MIFARKRYYIWLVRAYLKKWKRIIVTSSVLGGILFFALLATLESYVLPNIQRNVEKIGMSGIYTFDNLPEDILYEVSYGLTTVNEKGEMQPKASDKWEIKDGGKTYIFHLKKGQKFHNGKELNVDTLSLNFKTAKKTKIDKYTVSYRLDNQYSPFLSTVSKPIFNEGFSGLGLYKVKYVSINAGFITSITLENKENKTNKKIFYFYPTHESLKTAFALGEINSIVGLTSLDFKKTNFKDWKNAKITRITNYKELVTIFYNNSDQYLSNKKLRQALNFAIPQHFSRGEKVFSPIPPQSVYYNKTDNYGISDIEIAKAILSTSNINEKISIELSTTRENQDIAELIKDSWSKLGITTRVTVVDEMPHNFQSLLYSFKIPKDPDQYTLWHSGQVNNITHYQNLRIDKLLEDGRTLSDISERLRIYRDFQKYLLDDVPSSFLYFPYEYTVERTFL